MEADSPGFTGGNKPSAGNFRSTTEVWTGVRSPVTEVSCLSCRVEGGSKLVDGSARPVGGFTASPGDDDDIPVSKSFFRRGNELDGRFSMGVAAAGGFSMIFNNSV